MELRQGYRLSRGVVAAIATAVLFFGCGTPRTSTPPPTATPTPATTVGLTAQTAQIYLLQERDNKTELVARPVTLDKSAGQDPKVILEQAFQRLLAEGSSSEAGVSSAIPAGTKLQSLTVKDDTVSLDFSKEFTSGGGSASMTGRLGQVIYTATSLNPKAKIFLSVDGEPLKELGGEGLVVDGPLTRESFGQDFEL